MKKVFLAILVLISFSASAQWTIINGNQRFAKGLGIPTRDTVFSSNPADSSQIVLRPQDSTIYVKYKGTWRAVAGGSGTTPNLQQVTDVNATTTNTLRLYSELDYLGNYKKLHIVDYSPDNTDSSYIDFSVDNKGIFSGGERSSQILMRGSDNSGSKIDLSIYADQPSIYLSSASLQSSSYMAANTFGVSLNPTYPLNTDIISSNFYPNEISFYRANGNSNYYLQVDTFSTNYNCKLPIVSLSTQATDTLATLRNVRNGGSTIDTANKWVNNIYRKAGKDSIYFQIGSNEYKIKDSTATAQTFAPTTIPYANGSSLLTSDSSALRYFSKTLAIGSKGAIGEEYALDLDANRATIYGNFNGMKLNVGSGTTGVADSSKGFQFWNKGVKYAYFGTGADGNYLKFDSTNLFLPKIAGTSDSMAVISATTGKIKAAAIPSASGYVPYTGATADVDLGTFSLNAKAVKINGTAGNGHIDFKHQSADASATGSSSVLFANSDGDIKWKNDSKFYTTLKTSLNSANRVYTFQDKTHTLADSADVALKLNITDTTVFQRKSLGAYSFVANKTNAAASGTAQTFKDTSGNYTGTIAWTGTAPSGTATHTYRWTQIGKLVTLNVQLLYTVAGSSLSQVIFDLPSDCPTPTSPSGISGNSRVLYYGAGNMTSNSQLGANASRAGLIINATSTGYSLIVVAASAGYISASLTIQYYTN